MQRVQPELNAVRTCSTQILKQKNYPQVVQSKIVNKASTWLDNFKAKIKVDKQERDVRAINCSARDGEVHAIVNGPYNSDC